jgi:hypothetical protein
MLRLPAQVSHQLLQGARGPAPVGREVLDIDRAASSQRTDLIRLVTQILECDRVQYLCHCLLDLLPEKMSRAAIHSLAGRTFIRAEQSAVHHGDRPFHCPDHISGANQ